MSQRAAPAGGSGGRAPCLVLCDDHLYALQVDDIRLFAHKDACLVCIGHLRPQCWVKFAGMTYQSPFDHSLLLSPEPSSKGS